ncbi:MAG: class I SAM-dependent methyltransferase [Promethearchaeota archaeon]
MSTLKKEIKEAYDTIAYDYERVRKKPWHVLQGFFYEISLLEKQGCNLLDVGCGNGRHVYWLNEQGFCTYGIDISKNLIQIAVAKTEGIERKPDFIVGDSTHLPFKNEAFHVVLLVALLHHLPSYDERYNTLEETSRVLEKGGKAIISVWRLWQKRFLKYIIKELFKRIIGKGQKEFGDIYRRWRTSDKRYEVYRFYHLFRCKEIKNLIKKTQLKIVRLEKLGGKGGKENIFAYLEK